MGHRRETRPTAEEVRAVIAGWHLRIQTEIKRTSSLPTSMFDACDPMLEAALADSAAHIFRRLMAYGPPEGYEDPREEELRAESVSPEEIAALCVRVGEAADEPAPDLLAGSDLEYLFILLDFCLEERAAVRERARALLHQALGREVDVARLGGEILRRLRGMLDAEVEGKELDERVKAPLQRLCEEIEQRLTELRGGEGDR